MGQYYDDGGRGGGGFLVKHLVLLIMLGGVIVAGYIGWRLSDEALAVIVGVVISGLLLGIPAWLIVIMNQRARAAEAQERMALLERQRGGGPRPPLVLVQGGNTQRQELPPGWQPPPALTYGGHYGQAYGDGDLVDGETGYPITDEIREFGD